MSISQALTDMAKSLEVDAKEAEGESVLRAILRSYVRQLRMLSTVVATSEKVHVVEKSAVTINDEKGPPSNDATIIIPPLKFPTNPPPPPASPRVDASLLREDTNGVTMREVVGGPGDESMHPIPDNVPVGARTQLFGAIYRVGTDRRLYFDQEKTMEYVRTLTATE